MPELARYLKTGDDVALQIGRLASSHRGLDLRQRNVEVVGELVAQPMNGHPEPALGHPYRAHGIAEPVESLLEGMTGTSQV